jgi:2-methylisocitrate lyase-like PEP mutase family enzyme
MAQQSAGRRLRELLERHPIVVAPGIWDGLSARLVQQAGFQAAYCTGGGIARGHGWPDLGLVTLTELVAQVSLIAEICTLPLIVDLDSGFGNVLNIQRGVRQLERAGAAAIHLQDVEVPRRAEPVVDIIPVEIMVGRLRAAMEARVDADFMIIARTDVRPHIGLEAALERGIRYAEAGVDMVYVEGMETRAEVEQVARRVPGMKLISLNKGEGVPMHPDELASLGFRMLTHPADAQLAAIAAINLLLNHLRETGTVTAFEPMTSFAGREKIVGLAEARARAVSFQPK